MSPNWIKSFAFVCAILLTSCAPVQHRAEMREADGRPNILLIVADDLSMSDLGAFGGEIPTPNLDALTREGAVMTNFYSAPTCSPTRAMLLTGVDNHLAGLGMMAELMVPNLIGRPGYEGFLNDRVVTIAELLQANGYRTMMSGKWHLGLEPDQDPSERGFDRSFTMLMGGASHFSDMAGPTIDQQRALYRRDGKLVLRLPANFYSSSAYTDEIIDYIDEGRDSGEPFFAYVSYTAPHWPIQAPPELIAPFHGKYNDGYDVLRLQRFMRQKELGLLPPEAKLPETRVSTPWDKLSRHEKVRQARLMEIYAGMVVGLDKAVGRLLQHLRENGELDNTLVIFISDNGPEGTAFGHPLFSEWAALHDNSFDNLGKRDSFATVGPGWAEAGAAGFSGFKSYVSEGGIRVPAIVRYPELVAAGSRLADVASVKDVTPTILELTRTSWTNLIGTHADVYEPTGRSLLDVFSRNEPTAAELSGEFITELWGRRAIRSGPWKAVRQTVPWGNGEWQLFHVLEDTGETQDLSTIYPDRLLSLIARYEEFERANYVKYPDGAAGY